MKRPCLRCGSPTLRRRYCGVCQPTPAPLNRTHAEAKRRKAAVLLHVLEHGWWCPGYGVPAHSSTDLTADHLVPRVDGGEHGPIRILCRGCNSRRQDGSVSDVDGTMSA